MLLGEIGTPFYILLAIDGNSSKLAYTQQNGVCMISATFKVIEPIFMIKTTTTIGLSKLEAL